MINAGIAGGAGYTAGELLRILLNHPQVNVTYVHSSSQSGANVSDVHKDLLGETQLKFQQGPVNDVDVLFLCLGHHRSAEYLTEQTLPGETKVIDLSQDFRLVGADGDFVYGLPELYREQIRQASRVANPGCFATAIQLALLPLAKANLLKSPVQVHAITGSTGAGVQPLTTTHFSWRQNNLSVYKAFQHQHMSEIQQSLKHAGAQVSPEINFIPIRGDFAKGIFCTAYMDIEGSEAQFHELYREFYAPHPFTWIANDTISLKEVINTNKCFLHLEYYQGKLLITSILDNLIKGASGQAVQNMNLMFDQAEDLGLKLKATGF